jgi:hypothetical protein
MFRPSKKYPTRDTVPLKKTYKYVIQQRTFVFFYSLCITWAACRYIYGLVRQEELVAFYRDAAIGLITPLRDGMNLVAKVW